LEIETTFEFLALFPAHQLHHGIVGFLEIKAENRNLFKKYFLLNLSYFWCKKPMVWLVCRFLLF